MRSKRARRLLYTAMFDEINEGTAIFKLANDSNQQPVGTDLFALDVDGCRTAANRICPHLASEATRELPRVR